MKHFLTKYILGIKALLLIGGLVSLDASAQKFENYDIRVIRPKYFQKKGRFELGARTTAIVNETFVYTFMGSGLLTYHFNEYIALEGAGSYGFSVDREEKDTLFNQFDIRTRIFRTSYNLSASIQMTPIYGKWQLPSGNLIYFDSYFTVGGGLTGIYWDYKDFCVATKGSGSESLTDVPANMTGSYPMFAAGFGQRYFLNRKLSIKWDIQNHSVIYNSGDSGCEASGGDAGTDIHNSVTLQFGASRFF
jgi:outer membrane beta-barrel protein